MRPIHILFADDDEEEHDLLREIFDEIDDVKLISVLSGDAMMDFLNTTENLPDFILLDMSIFCKNETSCIDAIRNNLRFDFLPVLVYSGSMGTGQVENTYIKGANLYIEKPSDLSQIKKIFEKIFSYDWKLQMMQRKREKYFVKTAGDF